MGEEHNVVFGQGLKVNRAKSTLTSPSICLMRHIEGVESVLVALLTFCPCPKTTLCSSPIAFLSFLCSLEYFKELFSCENLVIDVFFDIPYWIGSGNSFGLIIILTNVYMSQPCIGKRT